MTKRKPRVQKQEQKRNIKTTKKNETGQNPITLEQDDDFIMLPTVDFCFKELMNNKKVRKGIIAALLGVAPEEIESTTLMETILRKEFEDDKYGILDVRVKLKDGTQIDFEMQVEALTYWDKRQLYYMSKMITDQLHAGDDYDKIQKCVHVSILDFNFVKNDNKWYRKVSFCDKDTGEVYTDLMEIYVLELKKLPPEDQNEQGLIKWMRFIKAESKEELRKMAEQDEYIEEAYKELERISLDEQKRLEYETRLKNRRDKHAMIQYAKEQGRAEGKAEGEARINKLIVYLLQQGRNEDLAKAASDSEYQAKLLKELGL